MIDTPLSNLNMSEPDVPSTISLQWRALSPRYARIQLLTNLAVLIGLIVLAVALYIQPLYRLEPNVRHALPYLTMGIFAFGSLISLLHWSAVKRKKYAMREQDIHLYIGLFFGKTISQPISRIQHVELKRGPLERKFGLASIQLFSAGGVAHTFEVPGLPVEKAKQLRAFVLTHKDVLSNG